MILSDRAIIEALASGELTVEPSVCAESIRAFGIRVHLAPKLLVPVPTDDVVDLSHPQADQFTEHIMDEEGFILDSHEYILGCTRERIRTSRTLACVLDGRSSIARQGLFVHCSSAIMDNVHDEARVIVLEMFNCSSRRIRLRPDLPIGMLILHRLDGQIAQNVAQQYAGQQTLLAPRPMFGAAGERDADEPS